MNNHEEKNDNEKDLNKEELRKLVQVGIPKPKISGTGVVRRNGQIVRDTQENK